ncbi:ADP-ribosylglycohydrolase family protein [Stackebrandtia soli]|uniref:ADP-ribosylglycohydrolase family protein n=1 Tax=Stackebrandtia soli TaxID=1892856 RepID=UPI0039E94964
MTTAESQSNRRRIRNAVLGAAIGDAMGWPWERVRRGTTPNVTTSGFLAWTRQAGSRFHRYDDPVAAGSYSDDTQLLAAVGRACLGDDWWQRWTASELPSWPLHQRGGGRAVLAAARSWSAGVPPWKPPTSATRTKQVRQYANAGANGVAMRILPHAIVETDPHRLTHRVLRDGFTTHGHPRALIGATLYAAALRSLLTGVESTELVAALEEDSVWSDMDIAMGAFHPQWYKTWRDVTGEPFRDVWGQARTETRDLLRHVATAGPSSVDTDRSVLTGLGCFDPTRNGAGHVTAVAAVHCATRAESPVDALARSAFLVGADTDTLASMTAALAALTSDDDWPTPLSEGVQDSAYLDALACALDGVRRRRQGEADDPTLPDLTTTASDARDAGRLASALLNSAADMDADDALRLPDGRTATIATVSPLSSKVRRLTVTIDDGQTAVIDVRLPKPVTPSRATVDPSSPPVATVQLRLPAQDLARTADFYDQVLGLKVHRPSDDELRISDELTFVESTAERTRSAVDAFTVLRIQVSDAAAAWDWVSALRLGEAAGGRPTEPNEPAYLRDPNGYRVAAIPVVPTD